MNSAHQRPHPTPVIAAVLVFAAAMSSPADARVWTNQDATATQSVENGVRVVRGPAPIADGDLDRALDGAGPRPIIRVVKEVRVVNCWNPRPLTTHGFLGVRRYNRSLGSFGSPTFGFDQYKRSDLISC